MLKLRLVTAALILVVWATPGFPWGQEGHRLTMKLAVELCNTSSTMDNEIRACGQWLEDRASLPDAEQRDPGHYINLDLLSQDASIPVTRPLRRAGGFLPTRLYAVVTELTCQLAFPGRQDDVRNHDLVYAGHYAADLCTPPHVFNAYKGVNALQTGFHKEFETELLERLEKADPGFEQGVRTKLSTVKVPTTDAATLIESDVKATRDKALVLGKATQYKLRTDGQWTDAKLKPFIQNQLARSAMAIRAYWLLAKRDAGK